MSCADIVEAAQVRAQFAELIGNLAIAGVRPSVVGSGALLAVIEFMMLNEGVEPTAVWLHNQARFVDEVGARWITAINVDGRGSDR